MNHYNQFVKEAAPEVYKRFGGEPKATATAPYLGGGEGDQKSNIPAVTMKNLVYLLHRALRQPADSRRAVLIVGEAGVGKSSAIKQFAKDAAGERKFLVFTKLDTPERKKVIEDPSQYYCFLDLRSGELLPEAVAGLPKLTGETEYLTFLPPDWVALISNPDFKGLVLLDEVNRAKPSILALLMRFVLDREIANKKISSGVTIAAAANMGSNFVQVQTMDAAQMGRYYVGALVMEPSEWVQYAKDVGLNDYIIEFAELEPDKNMFGRDIDLSRENVPVNPRQLEAASREMDAVVKEYEEHMQKGTPLAPGSSGSLYEDIRVSLAGNVGTKWIDEFLEFLRMQHTFDWGEMVEVGKQNRDTFRTKIGKQGQISAIAKTALARWATKQVITRYEKAKKAGDAAAIDNLVNEVYFVLRGYDEENIGIVFKNLIKAIRDEPPPGVTQLQAVKDWNALMIPIMNKAKKDDPEFFTRLSKLTGSMKELKGA